MKRRLLEAGDAGSAGTAATGDDELLVGSVSEGDDLAAAVDELMAVVLESAR
jgi:hypothetical protein